MYNLALITWLIAKHLALLLTLLVWWPLQKHANYCGLGYSVYILANGAVLISSCCVKTEAHLCKLGTICLLSQFSTLCSVNSSATFLWSYVARILFFNSYSAVPKKENLVGCYSYIVLCFVLIIYFSEKKKTRNSKICLVFTSFAILLHLMWVHHNNSMLYLAEWNFLNLLCFTFCYSALLLHFHTCSIVEVIALLECIGVLQSYSIVMSLVDVLNF